MAAPTPQEIAREAVKRLAARRLPPTPENFQAVYHEVAGTRPLQPFPYEQLRQIGQELPEATPGQQRFKVLYNKAVARHSWDDLRRLLVQQAWPSPTPAGAAASPGVAVAEAAEARPTRPPEENDDLPGFEHAWREAVARLLTNVLPALGQDDPRALELVQDLVQQLRLEAPHPPTLRRLLGDVAYRLSFTAEEQAGVRDGLLALLRQVFEHIEDLSPDNPWLRPQLGALVQAAQPPLTLRRLEELQRRLRDVTVKQVELREQTLQAHAVMKETLATFLNRLAQTTEGSAHYHGVFERCAARLESAASLAEMAPVVQEAVQAARAMAADAQRAGDELRTLRARAEHAEHEIQRLQRELDQMAEMVTHDLLTGVLNRKGLQEAVAQEAARAERHGSPVCIALLDIDDFKKLNDTLGHLAGDAALQHLAQVARQSLRPHDAIGRYGGEEFLLVLPDTDVEQAVAVVQRLQRDLSAHLFLQDDRRVLITFSAGVTRLQPGEALEAAIARADRAMYRAKRAGKNRVFSE
ncbi:GGDEF domain-containing protein [Tepidimonas taiwanensis]|uniref:GGDEF domain-containing protein n=1 Tax=Tepidimonas taiwanensis TaxID=307486 RepID=UPI000734A2DB|nr:GGDEF domain-containing protein [Tepidimonas taiwanensis]